MNSSDLLVCPHRADNWWSEEAFRDPYPAWANARSETPIFWHDLMNCYVLTRHRDVVAVLKDTDRFSSRDVIFSGEVPDEVKGRLPNGYPVGVPSLINSDPPHHSRVRKLVLSALSPRRVEGLRPQIQALAADLVAALPGAGDVDLMSALAVPLPTTVISRILGVPDADMADFKRWSDDILHLGNPVLDPDTRLRLSLSAADFNGYCAEMIALRRQSRGPDLLSELVWAGHGDDVDAPLNDAELISVLSQLVVAGNETTAHLIGNLTYLLLSHPRQWQQVCTEADVRANAIEEALRMMSPLKGLFRTTTTDVVLDQIRLDKGQRVFLLYGAANRDEQTFPDPDSFDVNRRSDSRHVAFGFGEHFCVGAALARMEAGIVLDLLTGYGERLSLAGEPTWGHFLATYGFERLPIAIAPAGD